IVNESGKPFFHIPFPAGEGREAVAKTSADFCEWLRRFQIRVLNIAGNRESQNPGVHEFTRKFLISNLESK
ncbi:MAG TPA: putative molybdenum carrier protein, partial [Terriglobia bacterium]|nr:putative molybdenum carrier protein [Terriglobia bacterium]